jgi:hypothetical protein
VRSKHHPPTLVNRPYRSEGGGRRLRQSAGSRWDAEGTQRASKTMDKGQALVGHYHDTYDVTWKLWEQRNKTFLMLLLVVGLANLFTNDEFLLGLMQELLSHIKASQVVGEFRNSLPYRTIHIIMLILVFYFTVNIYHRSTSVLRNYAYLGRMEKEIRDEFNLTEREVAFTRESGFYWNKRPFLFSSVKYFYILYSADSYRIVLLCENSAGRPRDVGC